MDDADTRWQDGGMYIVDNVIQQVGPSDQLPQTADELIDARGMAILPGLVNTHHHFYQTLTRNLPAAQDANLFTWLKTLYPIWANLTPEAIAVSAKIAIAELMLSGCTTSSDHTYIWPNGARLDDQIQAARERRATRRPDPGRARARLSLPRRARLDVGWRIAGWPAARPRGRGRGRDSARFTPPDRNIS
jgi:cytosine/adenosine deaminase-related metal-dependent hydrolase